MAGHEATKEVLDDQEGIMHACEGETSMMMALKPDLVDHARLPEAHGPNLGPSGALQRPLHLSISFKSITPTGVIGGIRAARHPPRARPSSRPAPMGLRRGY